MGTINIEDNSETEYSYKMLKSTEESKVEELINLANEMNKLDEKIHMTNYLYMDNLNHYMKN